MHRVEDNLKSKMTVYGRYQMGVSFPKFVFKDTNDTENLDTSATRFDVAYDLACQTLRVEFVDVVDEESCIRFIPRLSKTG